MPDTPIPADLLDLARRHQEAMAKTRDDAASGKDVRPSTAKEAVLARDLYQYREAHPEWAAAAAQKRVREEAAKLAAEAAAKAAAEAAGQE